MKSRFYTIAFALLFIFTGANAQVNKSKAKARKSQTAVKRTPSKVPSASGQKAMFCPNNWLRSTILTSSNGLRTRRGSVFIR